MSYPKFDEPGRSVDLKELSGVKTSMAWNKLCVAAQAKNLGGAMNAIAEICKAWKDQEDGECWFETLGDALKFLETTFRENNMDVWITSAQANTDEVAKEQGVKNVVCLDPFTNEEKPYAMFVTGTEEEAMAAPMSHTELLRRLDDTGAYVVLD